MVSSVPVGLLHLVLFALIALIGGPSVPRARKRKRPKVPEEAPAGWTRFPRLWCAACGRWKPLKNFIGGHRRDDGELIGKVGFSASGGYGRIKNGVDSEYSITECLDSGTSPHPLFDEAVSVFKRRIACIFCALFDRKQLPPGMLTGELARILDEHFRVVVEAQDLKATNGELVLQKENMREKRDEARIQAESAKQKAEALKSERDRCFRVIDDLRGMLLRAHADGSRRQAEVERLKARVGELEARLRQTSATKPGWSPPNAIPGPASASGFRRPPGRPPKAPRRPTWLDSLERKAKSNTASAQRVLLEESERERRREAALKAQNEKERRDFALLAKQPVIRKEVKHPNDGNPK